MHGRGPTCRKVLFSEGKSPLLFPPFYPLRGERERAGKGKPGEEGIEKKGEIGGFFPLLSPVGGKGKKCVVSPVGGKGKINRKEGGKS